jgi:hypothetical protein
MHSYAILVNHQIRLTMNVRAVRRFVEYREPSFCNNNNKIQYVFVIYIHMKSHS